MVLIVLTGYLIGHFLDLFFETKEPAFKIVLSVFFVPASIYFFYRKTKL